MDERFDEETSQAGLKPADENSPELSTDHQPLTTDHRPLTTDHRPLTTDHQPLTTNHRPLTTDHRPLAVDHRPLTTDHRPLTTDHRPLTTAPRVILFDIDGTLIKAVRRPEYRGAMREILVNVFGTFGRIGEVEFAGKTDLAIYREALESENISFENIRGRLPQVEAAMVELMDRMATTGDVYRLCPGVLDLLDALSADQRFVISLLTGNVERLAEAKLRVAGISHYFRERGAFGSDAEERDHLPAIAAERINLSRAAQLPAHRFIIIGDTPRDICCARHFGARVVAVASGQHTLEQLREHSPDVLLPDLGDTASVVALLAEI